jgi:sec-independent protein translocase protein TatB
MFGLTFDKLVLIAILAVFLVGPERVPHYARRLADLVRSLRDFTDSAKVRLRQELGPEVDEIDWKKLDPRQYDPRRIVREALSDDAAAGEHTEQDAAPTVVTLAPPKSAPPEAAPSTAAPLIAAPVKAGSDGRYRRAVPVPVSAPEVASVEPAAVDTAPLNTAPADTAPIDTAPVDAADTNSLAA